MKADSMSVDLTGSVRAIFEATRAPALKPHATGRPAAGDGHERQFYKGSEYF